MEQHQQSCYEYTCSIFIIVIISVCVCLCVCAYIRASDWWVRGSRRACVCVCVCFPSVWIVVIRGFHEYFNAVWNVSWLFQKYFFLFQGCLKMIWKCRLLKAVSMIFFVVSRAFSKLVLGWFQSFYSRGKVFLGHFQGYFIVSVGCCEYLFHLARNF